MKDLKDIWSQNDDQNINMPEFNSDDLAKLKERSDSPLKKLKRNIQINSVFGWVFLAGFIVLLFIVDGLWFRVFMTILCLAYVAGIFFNRWIIQRYLTEIPMDDSLLDHLKGVHYGMNKAFRAIEMASILIYPIAMTAGFLIPLTLENKLDHFNESAFLWILLLVLFIVLTPACFYLNRYMTKLAFGKYVKQIKDIVDEMELVE
jgi:hypothetical protein